MTGTLRDLEGNVIPVPGADTPVLLATTVVLTSAQLKALRATPVELVPDPGAGKVIFVQNCLLDYRYGGVAYVDPNSDFDAAIALSGGVGVADMGDPAITGASSILSGLDFSQQSSTLNTSVANSAHKALVIKNNGTAELTTGNGTLAVTTYYTVVDAS